MKKLRLVLVAILALCLVLSVTACNPKTPSKASFIVNWDSGANCTFKDLDGNVLSGEVTYEFETELKFTIDTGNEGVTPDVVKAGGEVLTPDANGVYTFVVRKHSRVECTTKADVISLEIKSLPTKLNYYSGDKLDTTGLVVTAKLQNGSVVEISDYTISYGTDRDTLANGQTSVTISYNGKSVLLEGLTVKDFAPYTDLQVTITEVGGKPTLTVNGKYGERDVAFLAIGNSGNVFLKADVTPVGDGGFTVSVDLSTVVAGNNVWYDLMLAWSEEEYIDLNKSMCPEYSQVVNYQNDNYMFKDWEGTLKVTRQSTIIFTNVKAEIVADNAGIPVLNVTGTLGTAESVLLEIKGCAKTKPTMNGNDFKFSVNLVDALKNAKKGDWLDLKLYYTEEDYVDVNTAECADMNASVVHNNNNYHFASWEDALKLVYETDTPVKNVKVELLELGGVPTLRVTGELVSANEVELRIKHGGTHKATVNGKSFTIEVNLDTALEKGQEGQWLDLHLYHNSSEYIDLAPEMCVDYSQKVVMNGRDYHFQKWDVYLKIEYKIDESTATFHPFKDVRAELLMIEGVPSLKVTGTLVDAEGAALYIKHQTAPFMAELDGKNFTIIVDLATALAGKPENDWMDLQLYYSTTDYVNLKDSQAVDMSAKLVHGEDTYTFHQWEGDLKVCKNVK